MPTSLLSSLSRGYGTWTGSFDSAVPNDDSLPKLDPNACQHRHGVTVTPRANTAPTMVAVADDGHLDIPKTFLTRKGALMLFSASDDLPQEPVKSPKLRQKRHKHKDVIDLSLKLRTLDRLSLSVLQYGDKSYDKEAASVSDKDSHLFLNFPHDEDQEYENFDAHSQPGGDLKFYLRDLKRRASCRGHGTGDSSPFRARSAELQEILDQLEQAWPRHPGSHRRSSMFTGSVASGEDFFHPSSPTPSAHSQTARSMSSVKVLSSKKLTASLKSLNYLGRPVSTEPEPTTTLNEMLGSSPEFLYGRSKSSRSSVWMADASSPVQPAPYVRPRTSTPHGGRGAPLKPHVDRKLVTSPEHTEDEGASEDGSQPVWVDVEGQGEVSYLSDDIQSQVSGTSDRGRAQGERSHTPVRGERDAMLTEAASVLSSLIEEEDMDVLIDDLSDEGEEVLDDSGKPWPSGEQGRKSAMSTRSRASQTQGRQSRQSRKSAEGHAQPLQPPYSGVMVKDEDRKSQSGVDDGGLEREDDEENLQKLQQDSKHSSRAASRAGTQTGSRPESALAEDRIPSRANSAALSRGATPAGFAGHSEQMIEQVTQMMSDGEAVRASSALGAASSSSAVRPSPDPDTLISLHKDEEDVQAKKEEGKGVQEENQLAFEPSATSDEKTQPPFQTGSKEVPGTDTKPAPTKDVPPKPKAEEPEKLEEPEIVTPRTPKRREKPKEVATPRIEDEEEKESPKEETSDGVPQLSERVIREKEEKEKKAAKLKEEKEKVEAQKREEEEKLRQQADDKKKAAEERLRKRAEEAAQRKEEEKKKQEEEAASGQPAEGALKPASPTGKKGTTPRGKAAAKGGKAGKKGAKAAEAETGDKKYVNALDITSVQPAEGAEQPKGLEALEKLKAANAAQDIPVDKLKDFMASQPPKPVIVKEKKEVQLTDHMKEMFGRKTEAEIEEEMDAELHKMQSAVDDALGGSVLQVEGAEGLSAEDFALAQEALMERIKKAQEEISDKPSETKPPEKKPVDVKKTPPTARRGKVEKKAPEAAAAKKKKGNEEAKKREKELAKEREAIKEQQRLEKQKRLEEAKALQQKISEKEESRKAKEAEAKRKAQELAERMESIRQEEEEIERAEEDARAQLAAVRKAQREEREARRKADLEKKKQDAIAKREKEKAMMDAARQKEQEMLDRIADAEMARRLREEEDAKREEEEMAAQERFEAEMKAAQRAAEEEEEKLRELERMAEEEAFQRLLDEKEEAERRRWELEEQARRMREEEEKMRQAMLEEEAKLEEEKRKKEAEEEARREQERERLRELQRLEEEARERMRAELEKRRAWALQRREYNLNARANLDAMRQSQGITDPWTFSYFVRWPKESYMRPMGQDPKKQKGFSRPKPKPPAPVSNANVDSTATISAVDVAAVPS